MGDKECGGEGEFSVINYVKYVIALSYKGLRLGPTHTHFNQYRPYS